MQALFRPVSMCVPDLSLICEIMLMAEGFQQSKVLTDNKKFPSLEAKLISIAKHRLYTASIGNWFDSKIFCKLLQQWHKF